MLDFRQSLPRNSLSLESHRVVVAGTDPLARLVELCSYGDVMLLTQSAREKRKYAKARGRDC